MIIKKNVILAPYTTFRIGGPARYFCEVGSVDDLKSALKFSKENNMRFFILGGGSNILISDKGFDGLVLKIGVRGLGFKENGDQAILRVGAGEDWDYVVGQAVERSLGGIENLSLIPGTAGAAVYGNIGAYGVELKDVLESAEVFDVGSEEIKTFSNKDCKFEYRDSVFKHKDGANLIILGADLRLSKNHEPKTGYPDLVKTFDEKKPSILEIRNVIIKIRRDKLPYPNEIGNVGSFFKNPVVSDTQFKKLLHNHPDLKVFRFGDGKIKLSAAQLIEKCGWKGKTFGDVGVSEKHSLVLVNHGKGTAREVVGLAGDIKRSINTRFGVTLDLEIQIVG